MLIIGLECKAREVPRPAHLLGGLVKAHSPSSICLALNQDHMFRVAFRNEGQRGQQDRTCRAGVAMPEQLQTCLLTWQHLGWRVEGRKNLGQGIY